MTIDLDIIQACQDKATFAPWFKRRWFRKDETWSAWFSFLRVMFGLDLDDTDLALFHRCTGRSDRPEGEFNEAWLICGRRAGKSFMLALIAVFLACFRDWRPYLAQGERATVAIIAADRKQARTIYRYVLGLLKGVKVLAPLIQRETLEGVDLTNDVTIEVGTASFKTVRGYTMAAVLFDELAFWSDEGANPDVEILAAVRPSMATVPGAMLLCASSPYGRRGALWEAFRQHHGKNGDPVLVWQAATRVMNPTVKESTVAAAIASDPARYTAEYLAQFRADVSDFVPLDVVEAATDWGVTERSPQPDTRYFAFADAASGTGQDSFALAIGHVENERTVVIDVIRERKPRFVAADVIKEHADILREYGISEIMSDNYAAGLTADEWRRNEIRFQKCKNDTAKNYLCALPMLTSPGRIHLLDNATLRAQLTGLERRVVSGHETVGHRHVQSAHDDVACAVCGCLVRAAAAGSERRGGLAIGVETFGSRLLTPYGYGMTTGYETDAAWLGKE
jgi:hypothetical protein